MTADSLTDCTIISFPKRRLPPVPRAGYAKGDFVRINATGQTGWVSRQFERVDGLWPDGLWLEVRVNGCGVVVPASGVTPVGAA